MTTPESVSRDDIALTTFPDDGMTFAEYEAYHNTDGFDRFDPVVFNEDDGRIYCVSILQNNVWSFFGWNPDQQHWDQLLALSPTTAYIRQQLQLDTLEPAFDLGQIGDADEIYQHVHDYFAETHENFEDYTYANDAANP